MADFDSMWYDAELRHELVAQLVDPVTRATLGSVSLDSSASLSEGYNSDTRISGSCTLADFGEWKPLSMLRLTHVVTTGARNGSVRHSETLGTFFCDLGDRTEDMASTTCAIDLKSALWACSVNESVGPYTVGEGSTAQSVLQDMAGRCFQKCRFADFNGYRYGSARTFDATNYLSLMMQVCSDSGNRVDVDADGNVTFSRYRAPHDRAEGYRIAYDSPLVISQSMTGNDDSAETADRSIVTWTYSHGGGGDSVTVAGSADVDASSPLSPKRRGYRVTATHSLNDVDSDSRYEAEQRARKFLGDDSTPKRTHTLTMRWVPLHEGDIVSFRPKPGTTETDGWRKCLVTDVSADLQSWTKQIKLKEV